VRGRARKGALFRHQRAPNVPVLFSFGMCRSQGLRKSQAAFCAEVPCC
jgi:hypothetical protein